MKMRSALLWLTCAGSLALAIACGKSGGGGDAPPAVSIVPTAIPSHVRWGFFAQNTQMDPYMMNMGSSYTIESGMNDVLKYAMRTCDRAAHSGGMVTCQSYMSGPQDIMIFMNGSETNQVRMVMRAAPNNSCTNPYYCSNYWYSLPSFKQFILGLFGFNTFNNSLIYNPLDIQMTVWPINDSRGFELRGNAPNNDLYYNSGGMLFQFQVLEGKLEHNTWDFKLIFNGKPAGRGRMVRCPSETCGIQTF